MAEKKKLTTEEILALARKKGASGPSSGGDSSASEHASAEPEAESQPSQPAASSSPKSTSDILAAARAQGSAGKSGSTEKQEKPAASGGAPKSTSDILAAARAQGSGGGAKPAAKPTSTADILAAARAQKGGAPKKSSSTAAQPAAAKAAPAKAGAAGERPPLKEMVAAVRQAQEGKAPPKLPSRQAPKLPKKAEPVSRRSFFGKLASVTISPFALAWTAVTGVGVLWSLGIARFMMPNMVLELPSRFSVGPTSDFPPGTVSEKYKASRGVWIVRTDQYDGRDLIYALLSICTHLGCTPNWLEGEQKFKCPCHGSGFYITGINFEGPAPRPLERVGLRIAEDGMLEVDKSLKFQEELGQWSDTKSFVEMV